MFGDNWSPSIAGVVALSRSMRVRASAGRGFRVPTFTERFYRDPYVADYARHSLTVAGGTRLGSRSSLGFRTDCKRKIDGRAYCGADLRATHRVGGVELLFDATNLFDVRYQEVKGVDMPPLTLSAGVRVGK